MTKSNGLEIDENKVTTAKDIDDEEQDDDYKVPDFDKVDFGPDACGILTNMDFGGMNLPEIIEELKDNCDDAGATRTDIFLVPTSDTKALTQIIVIDDGCGMTPKVLFDACRMAIHKPAADGTIGKFGMGMKNATMAAGRLINIFTKTASSGAIAIVLDTDKMKLDSTFRPTHYTNKAVELSWTLPKDIWRRFSSMPSGTLISVRNLKDTYVRNVADIMKELQRALNLAYVDTSKNITYIHSGAVPSKTSVTINPVDVFYRSRPDALKYSAETTLRVFRGDAGIRIFEVLNGPRILGVNKANKIVWADGIDKPRYYRIWIDRFNTNSGKDKLEYRHEEVDEIPNDDDSIEIKIRFISFTVNAFREEGLKGFFSEMEQHRRGIYMYRDLRLMAPCLTLGEVMDDKANRQRMEVVFPPALDFEMGVRTQKQMTNHLNSQIISDALRVLWHQQNSVCIRAKDITDKSAVIDDTPETTVVEEKPAPQVVAPKTVSRPQQAPQYVNNFVNEMVDSPPVPQVIKPVDTTPISKYREYGDFSKDIRARLLKSNPEYTPYQIISDIGRLWSLHTQSPSYTNPIPAAPAPPVVSNPPPPALQYPMYNSTDYQMDQRMMNTPEPIQSSAKTYKTFSDEIRPALIKQYPRWSSDQIIAETARLWGVQQGFIRPNTPSASQTNAKTKFSDEVRPWLVKEYPYWSTDQIMAETARLWEIRQGNTNTRPSPPLQQEPQRLPPPVSTRMPPSMMPEQSRNMRMPESVPVVNTTEIDWSKVLNSLPRTLPNNKNEEHVLNALLSVWTNSY